MTTGTYHAALSSPPCRLPASLSRNRDALLLTPKPRSRGAPKPRRDCGRSSKRKGRVSPFVVETVVSGRTSRAADRVEQKALLAVCSYPAIDRRPQCQSAYLLAIEARGELDCRNTCRRSCGRSGTDNLRPFPPTVELPS